MVTAGPTYEAIDPVRFIGNHASGLMGFTIAESLAAEGAEVVLIAGPSSYKASHPNIKQINIISAEEMYQACHTYFSKTDITVMAAAVADFAPADVKTDKIKKEAHLPVINLKPTKDILASLGKIKGKEQVLIGFALETNNEIENAKKKLINKNLDFVVLNSLNDKGAGFKTTTNKISIISHNKEQHFELKSKQEVANDIVSEIISLINIKKHHKNNQETLYP